MSKTKRKEFDPETTFVNLRVSLKQLSALIELAEMDVDMMHDSCKACEKADDCACGECEICESEGHICGDALDLNDMLQEVKSEVGLCGLLHCEPDADGTLTCAHD